MKDRDVLALPQDKQLDFLHTIRPLDEWHEDHGPVLLWHLPIQEPPYVGSGPGMGTKDRYGDPTEEQVLMDEGWLTHWSPLPICARMKSTDGIEVDPNV